jgi:hypothetical protein
VSGDTFLTAFDFEEPAHDEGKQEEEQEEEDDQSVGYLKSVATADYNPPPNEFFQDVDFEGEVILSVPWLSTTTYRKQ